MESPLALQCRALSPWWGLLITASILSCWIQPTSAQVTVVPNPPYGEVNHSVTLDIQGFSGQAVFYTWYRKAATDPNKIAGYAVTTGEQNPADIREKVLSNGSLFIPHLTLSDSDDYIVAIIISQGSIIGAQGHLTVYAEQSLGRRPTVSRGSITITVIGVLAGIILIGTLIYIQFFRRRASNHQLSEKNHSEHRHSEDPTLYENTVHLPGSALPAQGLGSSPAFSEVPPESFYETLDITRMDVYDKLNLWKQPEA
ncbi:carcinoembryonic antigen-related cell adhesion molecule 3-like [Antechinus flavipes]|uniref:carcinoembryonic antigen-related cell adhesion molecule 3-like n=1 Tax=Antechinus flavipes TaxID=38775 RepID=UPI002236AD97|nr:carcinoembryonic antigen-related cell adhesion molecule 3-like [Antechinus flavipes]